MASSHLIYFGTYTRSTSRGIYSSRLDDDSGALSATRLAAEAASPTWIVFSPDRTRLYSVHPSKAQAIGFVVDATNASLTPLPLPPNAGEPAAAPSHLAVDAGNRTLIAANYGDGYVATMAIEADGTPGRPTIVQHTGHGPNPKRQDKPHVHSATLSPDNRFVIVCDLGLDRIFTYALDAATATLTPAEPPWVASAPGAGPRHFKFGRDGRHAYNLTEMGATLVAYDYETQRGALTPVQTVATLPADFTGEKWAAEVRVHPNGRFVYASNRGHDSIAVFAVEATTGRLTLVEIVPSGGKVPRNFDLSPNGKWLVCAHQESSNVTVFRVDSATGRLTRTPHTIDIPMGVCVAFYN